MAKVNFVRARQGAAEVSGRADNQGDLFRFDAQALTADSGTVPANATIDPVGPVSTVNPYPSTINLASLGSYGIRIAGQPLTASGMGVSAAGDVNNDGINDFIIGGGGAKSSNGMFLGEEYVIFGKVGLSSFTLSTDIAAADGFRIAGENYAENSGTFFSYAGIGDINNDGFDDVMFGAPAFNTDGLGNNNVGAAYVVFGKGSGIGTVQLGSSMGSAGFKITGTEAQGQVGTVSAAGDFNHDGIADFAVAGKFVDGNGVNSDTGAVQIFFGKASGWANLNFGSNATPSVTLVGAVGDWIGGKISSAGDVNGDGIDDLIVNATHGATTPSYNSTPGYSYVVFGSASASGTINLSTMGASAGFKITGDTTHPVLGIDVAGIGDFNGDSFDDVAVSSGEYYGSEGRTYVIFGHGTGATVTVGDSMASTVGFEIIGTAKEDAGWSISRAGDINGDGLDDIILGAPDRNGGLSSSAYVIFGKASGNATINLSSLTAADGFKIVGTSGSTTGFSVAGVGDVNGDHIDDLLVAAPGEGASYVIFGISTNTAPVVDLNGAVAGTGSTLGYTENAAATALAPTATVTDAESANFDTGTLTVSFTANGAAEDRLSILNIGTAAGQIGISGANVTYGGVTMGTFTGGTSGSTPLVITLNANATPAATQALAEAIAYSDVSDTPSAAARTAQFVLTDGDGGTSSAVTATVNVTSVNDAPVFTGLDGTPDFAEKGAAVVLDNNATVTDLELTGSNYNGATLTLARSGGASAQDLFATTGTLALTGSGSGNVNVGATTVGTYTQSGGTLSISFNASATQVLVNSTLQQITYSNSSDAPPASAVIAYTFNDGNAGGQGTGGAGIANGSVTVSIAAVNDAPVNLVPSTQTIDEDTQLVFSSGNSNAITVGDPDVGAGTLTVTLDIADGALILGGTSGLTVTGQGGHHVVITGTVADINAGLNNLSYQPAPDVNGSRTLTVTTTDNGNSGAGAAQQDVDTITININSVDDPAVALDDPGNVTDENAIVNIAVLANDSDVDGPAPSVAQVDGQAISVGGSVILASGAKVTLEADGTLTYDPNGQFNALTSASSGEAGAVNTSASDSFTYTLAGTGGGTATVSVTVNGVAGAGDHLDGDSGDNVITGTGNGDYFDLSQGGDDNVDGGAGDDGFFFGAAFTGLDQVDGGPGTNDQIGLQGDYTGANALVLGANTIANIEALVVLPGFSYDITTVDANVAAGGVLNVQATQLAVGQSLTFDGSAETDGAFKIFGGNGDDNLTGGAGNDGFYFGPGGFNSSDIVNGGGGINDQLALDGDYTITLGGNVTNVEVLVLLHGPAATPNTFDVTSGNAFVAAGQTMTVFGLQVETGIIFNGSGELDGAFKIYGGTNADTLTGGSGADWIFGGLGADGLTGGAGNDTFYYDMVGQSTAANGDTIFDFATGDKVDVSGIDAIPGGANDAFSFLGSGAFTNHAGELRAENIGGNTWLVQGDTNGDGTADFQLTLITSDAHSIATADFTF